MELRLPQLNNLLIHYTFDNRQGQTIENVANPGTADAIATNVNYTDGVEGVAVSLSDAHSLIQSNPEFKDILLKSPLTFTWWGKGNFESELNFVDSVENPVSTAEIETTTSPNGFYNSVTVETPHAHIGITQGSGEADSDWHFFTVTLEFQPESSDSHYGSIKRIAYLDADGRDYLGIGAFEEDAFRILDTLLFKGNGGGLIDEVRLYGKALSDDEIKELYLKTIPIDYPNNIQQEQVSIDTSNPPSFDSPVFGKFESEDGEFAVWKDDDGNYWIDLKSSSNKPVTIEIATDSGKQVFENLQPNQRYKLVNVDVPNFSITATSVQTSVDIEKRSIIDYSTKTITFGDEASTTVQIPVLDITQKVNLHFGKYERLMPNGTSVIATVPASVESQEVNPTAEITTETINIENPGKPVKPNKADFINPETGELDKAAYEAAKAEYKEALAAYKTAKKTYKAAVKAVKLEAKGQVKSLKIEQKAIKTVNKALAKLVKGEQKADKYVTKAEVTLDKADNYRSLAEQLRAEANERATALLGENWTMEDLEAKLVKPDKADFIDPETGELDKDAYNAAKAEYKEAKAIAKLFKKADKYDLKADKLETKAELYQQKALDVTAKTVDKFKSTLESLIAKYTGKAESLKATGEGLLAQAQSLTGADYYKALGKGLYSTELAEGYARGAEIATAVLETYVDIDVSVNPDVAASLENVDISNINVSI